MNCEKDRELFAKALQEAFIRKFEADLAEPIIDVPTGTVLTPGNPDECLGGDSHPEHPLCCDGCDYLAACYPT